jgi:hypothetical protein
MGTKVDEMVQYQRFRTRRTAVILDNPTAQGFDVWHMIETAVGVAAIFIPLWWSNRSQNTKQHKENSERLEMLINENEERPSHKHPELNGPLTAEKIIYSPKQYR